MPSNKPVLDTSWTYWRRVEISTSLLSFWFLC